MRRFFMLLIVALLGTIPIAGPRAAAQGGEDPPPKLDPTSIFAEDLAIEQVAAAGNIVEYNIAFELPGSYIPERLNPDSMVVKVLTGRIAFRVQTPGVVVETQGPVIQLMVANPPIPFGENPNPDFPTHAPPDSRLYSDEGDLPGTCATDGTYTFCALDPSDFASEDRFVALEAGYTVFLPPGSVCFLCNITPLPGDGSSDQTASVLVWTTQGGFDHWSDDPPRISTQAGQTVVERQGLLATRAWAFNPGSNCK